MAKDKITRGLITGPLPTYINGVLHMPGEVAPVNLAALGIDEIGKKTPGMVPHSGKETEPVTQAAVAAVAPHAPDAPNPQGLPTGTLISGTGRHIVPDVPQDDEEAAAIEPVGADKPGVEGEQTPTKPSKSK
jgi:hypothetical protein